MTSTHLRKTELLDYDHDSIARLIKARGWTSLPATERIGAVYAYVRDEVGFGYNVGDRIPASQVLADGYGQCNTKATLVMALLRAVGIPCRLHGATIHKRLQKGVVTGFFYWLAPTNIIHTWAEVKVDDRWVSLEGIILDKRYLEGLRAFVPEATGTFFGYGVGTDNIDSPPIEWKGMDTAIQMAGVNQDFGTYDDPDTFYAEHGANLSGVTDFMYRRWIRHRMNERVASIRGCTRTVPAGPYLTGLTKLPRQPEQAR